MNENCDKSNFDLDEYHHSIQDTLAALEVTLDSYKDVIEEDYSREIKETVRTLYEVKNEHSKDRLLNLGIVGQVNSGKSTLLNALLFDGKEVLPRSATPMTASLTKIQWSKQNQVCVEFYSHSDWEEFEMQALYYRDKIEPTENQDKDNFKTYQYSSSQLKLFRASYEIVEMARCRRIPVQEHLDKSECFDAPIDKINEILQNHVGVNGKLTPIVKSITILCEHGIPDLTVIDTPGINDPVVSRSRETKQYLRKCDAVLMLSYASQFMEAEDLNFFQKNLSDSGIEKKLIIGSKFDSALIDVSQASGGDLHKAVDTTILRLKDHASQAINQNYNFQNFSELEEYIEFVSAQCTSLLSKPTSDWNDEEQVGFLNLCNAYPDWFDKPVDGEINSSTKVQLKRIGNMSSVEEYIDGLRKAKSFIMERKNRNLISTKHQSLEKLLEQLEKNLESNHQDIREELINETKARIVKLKAVSENIRDQLQEKWNDLFDKHLAEFVHIRHQVIKNKKAKIYDLAGFEIKPEEFEEDVPGIWATILRLLGLGGRRVVTYPELVESKSEICNAIDDFIDLLREIFEISVSKMYQPDFRDKARVEMNNVISNCVTPEIASNLDNENMRRLIWRSVGNLCERAKHNLRHANNELYNKTGGAKGSDSLLQSVLSEGTYKEWAEEVINHLAYIFRDLTIEIEENLKTIGEEVKNDLMPQINHTLDSEEQRIKEDLKNREFRQQRYKFALDSIQKFKNQFKKTNFSNLENKGV